MREEWYARQQELGIISEGTELAPRNPGVQAWDEMAPNAQRFALALQEAFAAFLDHTDAQIGRLIDYLEQTDQLDNTVVLLMADNGASQEGGPQRVADEARLFMRPPEDLDALQSRLHEIGGLRTSPNYPWGWAQAGNSPLRWYKQNTHGGGVRVPLIAHWPEGIADRGGIRRQSHHLTPPLTHIPSEVSPAIDLGSWTVDAAISRGSTDEEGVIFTRGNIHTGMSFFVQDNSLQFDYHAIDIKTHIRTDAPIPSGDCTVSVAFESDEPFGPARVTLSINGQMVGEGVAPVAQRRSFIHAMMDIGADVRSPVSDSYEPPFPFRGEIHTLDIEVTSYEGDAALQALAEHQRQAMSRQ